MRAKFQQQGAEPTYLPSDQAAQFIVDEIAEYRNIIIKAGAVIRAAGLQPHE